MQEPDCTLNSFFMFVYDFLGTMIIHCSGRLVRPSAGSSSTTGCLSIHQLDILKLPRTRGLDPRDQASGHSPIVCRLAPNRVQHLASDHLGPLKTRSFLWVHIFHKMLLWSSLQIWVRASTMRIVTVLLWCTRVGGFSMREVRLCYPWHGGRGLRLYNLLCPTSNTLLWNLTL